MLLTIHVGPLASVASAVRFHGACALISHCNPARLWNGQCVSTHIALARDGVLPAQVAANLLTGDVLMRSYQLTPEYRPLVDLSTDLAPTQGNKGWYFGYSDALVGSTASFRPFKYEAHGNGQLQDGRWMVREV